ncbi:MAG: GDP-mannose 4,6-dehydratase [Elusimicrobia bacterium]|nr:GDP-mannose 4,6-dehydratase [Elusimicrobiota bacterium]
MGKTDRTLAVIGSNCFTGSHFVDALLEDPSHRVIGISRSAEKKPAFLPYARHPRERFEFHRLNTVREMDKLIELLDARKPFCVINVAGLSEVNLSNFKPLDYFHTNTVAVADLCSRLRERKWLERFLHVSSAEIYGTCEGAIPESAPLRPSTPYAVSKAAADMYLSTLWKNFGFPMNLVRSTNVYGRHQQLFKIVPRSIINLKRNMPIRLEGGGMAVKSFVHVRDVVRGALSLVENGKPGDAYHFSTDNKRTVADVVRLVCELMQRDFDSAVTVVGDRLGQDSRYWLDCSKAARELDWKPEIGFEQGVQETIDWVERDWSELVNEPDKYVHSF